MTHWVRIFVLLLLLAAVPSSRTAGAHQSRNDYLPGVTVETIARGSSQIAGEDLVLLRITLSPEASISPGDQPTATLLSVESGGAVLTLLVGGADVTRQRTGATERVEAGAYVTLDPGDTVAFDSGSRLSIDNPSATDATYLVAALVPSSQLPFAAHPAGSFSVETYACPAGMTIATLDPAACSVTTTPLVRWQLESDAFRTSPGAEDPTVEGATTTWEGLPEGAYFVDLTAEGFAPGFVDYFIPSSDQVTRQGERTTRFYYDSERSRGNVGAYVFAGEA